LGRTVKIIITILLIGIVGFGGYYFYMQRQQNTTQTNTTTDNTTPPTNDGSSTTSTEIKTIITVNPQDYDNALQKNFDTASQKASQWQSDAKFVYLQIDLPNNLNPDKANETYVFISAKSPSNYWTIAQNLAGEYIRAIIPKTDFLKNGSPKEIFTKYWKTDWITAFQKADLESGKAFREKYPNDLEISANLTHGGPNDYLTWIIKYNAPKAGEKLEVQVDAATGEINQSS